MRAPVAAPGLLAGLLLTHAATVAAAPPEARCAAERLAQHRAWHTQEPARDQPPGPGGAKVRHFPTAALGVWVVEIAGPDEVSMTRVAPDEITRIAWTSSCVAASRRQARPRPATSAFRDADLVALLRDGRGVIYVWSPHMPLSVDAIGPLSSAAAAEGLAVTLLLDPAADTAFATRIATERGLPAAALRAVDSVELQFRDLLVHAPTVQVYAGSRLVGSPYPGGHTADEYAMYFRRVLRESR